MDDVGAGSIALIIATFILVGITGYYAVQTRKTVKVLEKTAELSVRPQLKGTLQPIGPVNLDLMIKNIGNGSANGVELSYWLEGCDQTKRNWTKPLISPNDYDTFFIPVAEDKNETSMDYFKNNQTIIRIVGKYHDILGNEHKIDDSIDVTAYVKQFEVTSVRYSEPTDEQLVKHLKEISTSITEFLKKVQPK